MTCYWLMLYPSLQCFDRIQMPVIEIHRQQRRLIELHHPVHAAGKHNTEACEWTDFSKHVLCGGYWCHIPAPNVLVEDRCLDEEFWGNQLVNRLPKHACSRRGKTRLFNLTHLKKHRFHASHRCCVPTSNVLIEDRCLGKSNFGDRNWLVSNQHCTHTHAKTSCRLSKKTHYTECVTHWSYGCCIPASDVLIEWRCLWQKNAGNVKVVD